MTKLEEYKSKFEKDYSKAVKEFNDGEFQSAQRDLRPGIEKFCKLIMYDMANDEKEVNSLINGTNWLSVDYTNEICSIQPGRGVAQEGASLADLTKKYIFYRRQVLLDHSSKLSRRLKNMVDSDFETLKGMYGTASELAQHDDSASNLDMDTQSIAMLNYMPKIFNDLKTNFLSNETWLFLDALEKPHQEITKQNDDAIRSEEENNDFVLLDQLTNHFDRTSGTQYVALLPETIIDKNGKLLSQAQLLSYTEIGCRKKDL